MVVGRKGISMVGSTMYDDLRSEMESTQRGRMIVIDVNTGDNNPTPLGAQPSGQLPGVSI